MFRRLVCSVTSFAVQTPETRSSVLLLVLPTPTQKVGLIARYFRKVSTVQETSSMTSTKTVAPYGSWESPISSKLVTESGVGLQDVRTDCNPEFTDTVYWTELRYEEQGRYVICSSNISSNASPISWTPKDFNARTTVHEYGGGAFCIYSGAIYFSNFSDQGLYVQQSPDSAPKAVSDLSKKWRFADSVVSPKTGVLYCVREDHEVLTTGAKEPQNCLVAINLRTKQLSVLEQGSDFYSHPRVSPDGQRVCWIQWNHPNMPWDDTEVWVADLDDSGCQLKPGSKKKMAGGANESAIEPGWTANNELLYVSDRTNWWNLYHVAADGSHVNLRPDSSEIAGPQWRFGQTAYVADLQNPTKILTLQNDKLGMMDTENPEKYVQFDTGFFYNKCLAYTSTGDAFFIGSGPSIFVCLLRFNIHQKKVEVIKKAMSMDLDPGYLSRDPQFIQWDTTHNMTSHGIFFPPANKDFEAPQGSLPPVLVRAHGGPTGHYFARLDLELQYFTSRGFAVLLVNYRGSTGHGRQYRHLLQRRWGVYDVDDCCSGVDYLVRQGLVDGDKACIDGGSAGGYTTLSCLTFRDTFKAGASHYGIGDLEALVSDTHKFESRYVDGLLLPASDPNCKALLTERSPIHHTHRLSCPIALFQGDQDKVVPPNQAIKMYDTLKEKGLPCLLVMFEGEQHGFLKAENIQAALDKEFAFFGKVLDFTPADSIEELHITNLNK